MGANKIRRSGRFIAVYAKECMTNFLSFLNENSHGKSIVLVSHNDHVFGDKHLVRALNHIGLTDDFKSIFECFIDTLPAFRKKHPGIFHKQSDPYVHIKRSLVS